MNAVAAQSMSVQREKLDGSALRLCTASRHRLATTIAGHLGLFDGLIASSDRANLAGSNKAGQLTERVGARGFDYAGNYTVDLAIWRISKGAIVVNGSAHLEREVRAHPEVLTSFHNADAT